MLFVLLPAAFAALGMWLGWRRRRQRDVARFEPLPGIAAPPRPADARLRYTGTTTAGSWLDRIALPGLFGRGDAQVWFEPDRVVFQRSGGPVVAAAPVITAAVERGHAGQTVGHGRVLVVRWQHRAVDGTEAVFDTGFVCATAADAAAFADRVRRARVAA